MLELFLMSDQKRTIIFFDGICHTCNSSVNWIMKQQNMFYFAPLQGLTAQQILSPQDIKDLNSLIVWSDEKKYYRSNAILFILNHLNGWPKVLFYVGRLIPSFLLDPIYNIISKYRFAFHRPLTSCRLANPQDRILP